MNINFDKEMEKIISLNQKLNIKPKLLLHACCAPCSTFCIERVREYFDLTMYFYNPNMDEEKEYLLRANELIRLCETLGIKYIIEPFMSESFYSAVKGLEQEKEGGKRCYKCFTLRLGKTLEKAKELDFDYFTTTLTVSPYKNSAVINEIGLSLAEEKKPKYLPSDFKKHEGYLKSIELSKKYGLYRQNYCGCIYSKRDREEHK